jgi:hypothetical protein
LTAAGLISCVRGLVALALVAGALRAEAACDPPRCSLAVALDAAGVPYQADLYRGGYHGWPYWERALHWALPQIMAVVGPRERAGAGDAGP